MTDEEQSFEERYIGKMFEFHRRFDKFVKTVETNIPKLDEKASGASEITGDAAASAENILNEAKRLIATLDDLKAEQDAVSQISTGLQTLVKETKGFKGSIADLAIQSQYFALPEFVMTILKNINSVVFIEGLKLLEQEEFDKIVSYVNRAMNERE